MWGRGEEGGAGMRDMGTCGDIWGYMGTYGAMGIGDIWGHGADRRGAMGMWGNGDTGVWGAGLCPQCPSVPDVHLSP